MLVWDMHFKGTRSVHEEMSPSTSADRFERSWVSRYKSFNINASQRRVQNFGYDPKSATPSARRQERHPRVVPARDGGPDGDERNSTPELTIAPLVTVAAPGAIRRTGNRCGTGSTTSAVAPAVRSIPDYSRFITKFLD